MVTTIFHVFFHVAAADEPTRTAVHTVLGVVHWCSQRTCGPAECRQARTWLYPCELAMLCHMVSWVKCVTDHH